MVWCGVVWCGVVWCGVVCVCVCARKFVLTVFLVLCFVMGYVLQFEGRAHKRVHYFSSFSSDYYCHKTLTNVLLLGRSEVLRSLRHYLRVQSQGHHTIDRLEERDVERGRSPLKGREMAIVNQTNTGIISKATLGKPLSGGVERICRALFRAHRYHLVLN